MLRGVGAGVSGWSRIERSWLTERELWGLVEGLGAVRRWGTDRAENSTAILVEADTREGVEGVLRSWGHS